MRGMAHLISFTTAKFDGSKEETNPVNPIAGQSVLLWLAAELAKAQYECSKPATEDWGWYIDVNGRGASYLLGASADADPSTPDIEWIVQLHRNRSLKDKLLGRNLMTPDDALSNLIEHIVRSDTAIRDVSVDRRP
jgi:hypothetical protein